MTKPEKSFLTRTRDALFQRKLIQSQEAKISVLQFIGFLLLLSGVIALVAMMMGEEDNTGSDIALLFFLLMLGLALAFPSLLEDRTKGLSTMRIVVFMMTNVVCMLLLNIGWGKAGLDLIKLDWTWVTVIVFLFGAKAMQAFFESRILSKNFAQGQFDFSADELAKLAVSQNQEFLKIKFPNILSISDTVKNTSSGPAPMVNIYVRDSNTSSIPSTLQVHLQGGKIENVVTDVVGNVGEGSVHAGHLDPLENKVDNTIGSVCCMATNPLGKNMLVSSGHVYSGRNFDNKGGPLAPGQRKK